MRNRVGNRLITEQRHDEEVRPYIQQLMKAQSCSQAQTSDDNNSIGTVDELNNESGPSEARKVRGPTLLKDVWNLPSGKTIVVQFNSRNQPIEKEGRKLASFLGIIARTPDLTPLNANDWRVFDEEEKIKLMDFVRKKFSIPIHGEDFVKKSIGKKWRDYKCDLKAMYVTKYKTKDALMKNRPSHIPRDQWCGNKCGYYPGWDYHFPNKWNSLVSYWLSEKQRGVVKQIESTELSKICLTREDPKA